MRPPPKLTISQWADLERKLSPESSAEPGQWTTSRAEYERGFMDAISDPRNLEIVGVWCSQGGKTDTILNVVGFHIHHDPAPMLIIHPTLEMAEAWSKDRLAPMLRDSPALRGRVKDARSRDSGNTIRHKSFPGGHLTATGANSAASLASRPIRILLCDEVDRYPPSAGSEGDPVKLAETRTVAFWNAKKVYISSPGTKGVSRLEGKWEQSDQRRFFVPCPDCREFQTLRWEQVQWDKDEEGNHDPETAGYVCESCGVLWNDIQRWAAVRKGEWRATKPFKGVAGFHVNALAAPWESRRLSALVGQWLEAQGNPILLKVFINTVLAEWWEDEYQTVGSEGLQGRREEYPRGPEKKILVPKGVAILTAGVDLQDDRLEVQVIGWGRGEESWVCEYHVMHGDPSAPALWADLWQLLTAPRPMERGDLDYIRATAVDTGGHYTQSAYEFCRPRFRVPTPDGRRAYVFAVKGQGGAGQVWPRQASKTNIGKVPLWMIRVDPAKESIYGRLLQAVEPGPGCIHFPTELGDRYFEQLTAEKVVTRHDKKGFPVRVWELKGQGRRNEALDTFVYGYAALCGLRSMGLDLEQEAERAERIAQIESPPVRKPEDEPERMRSSQPRTKRRRWKSAQL